MNNNWHKLNLSCPKCNQEVSVTEILCSADGEILVNLECKPCKGVYQYLTSGAKLILKALTVDLEGLKPAPSKPVKPPMKQIASQSDKDFLHDMGIEGGLL